MCCVLCHDSPWRPSSYLSCAGEEMAGCRCGRRRSADRIVGGEESLVLEYPWMASLRSVSGVFCGGSLVGDQCLVTAAHCTHLLSPGQLSVHLAHHRVEEDGLQLRVSRIVTHPRYDALTSHYDVALVKLEDRLQFGGCAPAGDSD